MTTSDRVGAHLITREIGIDAGHRVTNHGSKCRNVHGHRYRIEVVCLGRLQTEGEQEGMLVDFGFLKQEMVAVIDQYFDHGMILWRRDELTLATLSAADIEQVDQDIETRGFGFLPQTKFWGKLVVIPSVPTAENLAELWYKLLEPRVLERSNGHAEISHVKVWETPNCSAIYVETGGKK